MLLDITILLILLVINGFMSMAETSLISCRSSHIKARLKVLPHAETVNYLLTNPGEFLSALQIGITVISIFSGAYTGQQLAEPFAVWLNGFDVIHGYGAALAFTFIVIILTYVTLLLSELVPKRIALSHPEKIALYVAGAVRTLTRCSYYIVKILDVSTRFILNILGFHEQSKHVLTGEDFQHIFQQGFEDGAINSFEHSVLRNVMFFENNKATSLMTPRITVHMLYVDHSIDTIMSIILKNPRRYYPVMQHDPESILGVIDVNEIFIKKIKNEVIHIHEMIQTAPIVMEDAVAPHILQCFRDQNIQIALVVDTYGFFQGVITPHDILESLIGNCISAQRQEDKNIIPTDSGAWLCGGSVPLRALEELLDISMKDPTHGDDCTTLEGFMLSHLHDLHDVSEFPYKGFIFEVKEVSEKRIIQALIHPPSVEISVSPIPQDES